MFALHGEAGVRGGSRLGRHHRVVPLPVPAGPGGGACQHQRRLHAPHLRPRRRRRRHAHRLLPPHLRAHLLHLPLPGAWCRREGVLAGQRRVPDEADPVQPLHLLGGRRRQATAGGRRRGGAAAAVADGGGRGPLRVGVRADGLHGAHQLLPQHGPQLGAGGAVGGRQGAGAHQVHRRRRRPHLPLPGHPGLHPQGRVRGRRPGARERRRHPRRRPLRPAGEGRRGQPAHLRLHLQVLIHVHGSTISLLAYLLKPVISTSISVLPTCFVFRTKSNKCSHICLV
ncbi:Epoxide hydrolase isoform 3 [Zea mays]|uniref:Soluble epoxide hydrolase n=2 Tax=Zea mays TaxID=4577 RepID=C0P5Q2_MAIZE|nr:Epoxide hydrolase isoform 3 [Zea mays]ACN28318.1 unknown [Zea mays]AQK61793.1 soluble epoxide hydrolase [Zea mays]|eukprot:NP_001168469.1 uncharacterized protein LOC100191966 isoform 3 [Zea mays]